jgi:hypothetical protein
MITRGNLATRRTDFRKNADNMLKQTCCGKKSCIKLSEDATELARTCNLMFDTFDGDKSHENTVGTVCYNLKQFGKKMQIASIDASEAITKIKTKLQEELGDDDKLVVEINVLLDVITQCTQTNATAPTTVRSDDDILEKMLGSKYTNSKYNKSASIGRGKLRTRRRRNRNRKLKRHTIKKR